MPLYLASILMGAMSPDHTDLQMTARDASVYNGMSKWKRKQSFGVSI